MLIRDRGRDMKLVVIFFLYYTANHEIYPGLILRRLRLVKETGEMVEPLRRQHRVLQEWPRRCYDAEGHGWVNQKKRCERSEVDASAHERARETISKHCVAPTRHELYSNWWRMQPCCNTWINQEWTRGWDSPHHDFHKSSQRVKIARCNRQEYPTIIQYMMLERLI